VVAVVQVQRVRSDLPIHCLNSQVAGTWVFERSADTYDKTESCGYHAPDVNALHFQKPPMKFEVKEKRTFTLVQPNQVHDKKGRTIGHWTMVYDEGFEVVVDGWTYFAFNEYHPKPHTSLNSEDVNDYVSVCDRTMVGWMHDARMKRFGCFRGYQTARLRLREMDSSVDEAEVEETEEADHESEEAGSEKALQPAAKSLPYGRIPFNPNHVVSPFAFDSARDNVAKPDHPVGTSGSLTAPPTAFYELHPITDENRHESRKHIMTKAKSVDTDAVFAPDYAFIDAHNSNSKNTWRASVHEEFLGKRMSEMMRLLGRRTFNHKVGASGSGSDEGADERGPKTGPKGGTHPKPHNSAKYQSELAKLPKDFSWIKYDSPVRNQGECGACYSLAAMTVYETRLRIKTHGKDKTMMSGQDVLSCSRTNQGCEGGYPFLVGKHAMEYGLVPESCVPYKASDVDCDSVQFTSASCANKRYYARNYRYVGGYYGSCNELLMMKEVMKNGPVIVAFQAPSSLFYYTGGIFTGPPPKREGRTQNGVRYWEQTNHAVVAVGWGEENGQKYWIIKNTWGPKWGEKGYFRIQRGNDECGIESMATTFDVVV